MNESFNITDGVDFISPFCQGKCTASVEQACVLHAMPMCETYEQLEPDAFLKAVNDKIAERKVNG